MEKAHSLKEIHKEFETFLEGQVLPDGPQNLYDPIRYIMHLGGKRVRPLLTISSCLAAGGTIENAMPVALAMEQFHNFTLIHDDIMDNAELRRGKKTVHAKWNLPVGILSGDNLLVLTYSLLHGLSLPKKQEILLRFDKTAREVCEGQQMDMDFISAKKVSTSDYVEMIRLKTAVLLGCSAATGALAANADKERVDMYYQFAVAMGIAFQLRDDYLDVFGSEKKTGKKTGGDIAEGKKTWLFLAAKEARSGIEKVYAIENIADRIDKATALYQSLELDKKILQLAVEHDHVSMKSLESLENYGEDVRLLRTLQKQLSQREN